MPFPSLDLIYIGLGSGSSAKNAKFTAKFEKKKKKEANAFLYY